MKHVRANVTADGREGEIHPMYGVMANADFVERGTALQWNFTGDALGILHYIEGDIDAYEAQVDQQEQHQRYNDGLTRTIVLSLLSMLLLAATAFVPSRY